MEGGCELEKKKMKMKILCLHGFRTSGSFLCKQLSKWDPSVFKDFDLVFLDGIFPAGGKSDIEGIFPPPYFEWFQFNKDFTEYTNLDECVSFLSNYMTEKGPFDGLLGFSQVLSRVGHMGGMCQVLQTQIEHLNDYRTFDWTENRWVKCGYIWAYLHYRSPENFQLPRITTARVLSEIPLKLALCSGTSLSALLIAYQAQGKALQDHPPIKFFVAISGSKFRDPSICNVAYKDPIKVKSVHLIGDKDWLGLPSEELATAFDDPFILRHPQGHTVPKLDEMAIKQLTEWTRRIIQNSVETA